jgi:hypothetical protein
MDLHEGCAPIDRSGAFAPLPHDQPSGRLDAPMRIMRRSGSQKGRITARIAVNSMPAQTP